jgi:hypothetical protein
MHVPRRGEGDYRLTAPIDLSLGITDDPILKPCADNRTDEVAAVVESHHNSTIRGM